MSTRRRLVVLLAALTLLTGCHRRAPASPAPASSAHVEPGPASHHGPRPARGGSDAGPTDGAGTIAPTAHARPPRHHPHLIRTSGQPIGPIPYITVEPVIADHSAPPTMPLVIALHGRGDTARAFARLIEALDLPVRAIVGQGPIRWGPNNGTEWFDGTGPKGKKQILQRMHDLRVLVGQLAKTYPGAPKPILLGFSQGAILTIQAIAREPELFSAGVALSGSLPITKGNVKAKRPVPILLTVGDHDTLVPPAETDAAKAALQTLGNNPIIFRFPRGHAVTEAVRRRTRAFIEAQIRTLQHHGVTGRRRAGVLSP